MEMQEKVQVSAQAPLGDAVACTPSKSGAGPSGNLSTMFQLPAMLSGLPLIGLTEATGLAILAKLQGLRAEQVATLLVIASHVSGVANLLEGAKVSCYRHINCIYRHHC
jgi:hypothetical protein